MHFCSNFGNPTDPTTPVSEYLLIRTPIYDFNFDMNIFKIQKSKVCFESNWHLIILVREHDGMVDFPKKGLSVHITHYLHYHFPLFLPLLHQLPCWPSKWEVQCRKCAVLQMQPLRHAGNGEERLKKAIVINVTSRILTPFNNHSNSAY